MRSKKSRGVFFAFGAVMAFAAVSACLSISGCNSSATGPTDTSEILLVYPKGGETFKIGSTMVVKWTEQGQGKTDVNAVVVQFSPDDGKTWINLTTQRSIVPGDADWEKFSWLIPDTLNSLKSGKFALANNAKCRIKVEQYEPQSIFETSKDFTITP